MDIEGGRRYTAYLLDNLTNTQAFQKSWDRAQATEAS
jgi:hypothetical protein